MNISENQFQKLMYRLEYMQKKVITMESAAFKKLMMKLSSIEKAVKSVVPNNQLSKWVDEDETMRLTNLSRRTLADRRREGVFNYSTFKGRKLKYLRKDIEGYLDNNSTLRPIN